MNLISLSFIRRHISPRRHLQLARRRLRVRLPVSHAAPAHEQGKVLANARMICDIVKCTKIGLPGMDLIVPRVSGVQPDGDHVRSRRDVRHCVRDTAGPLTDMFGEAYREVSERFVAMS